MKSRIITAVLLTGSMIASAQVASHAPTQVAKTNVPSAMQSQPITQPTGKTVAKVNGVVLTDKDLLREMYSIFPYARQHNGFPRRRRPGFGRVRWR